MYFCTFYLTFCSTFRLNSLISSHFMPRLCSKRTWNTFRNNVLNWSKLKLDRDNSVIPKIKLEIILKRTHTTVWISYFTHLEIGLFGLSTRFNKIAVGLDKIDISKSVIHVKNSYKVFFTVFTLIKHSKNKTKSPLNWF